MYKPNEKVMEDFLQTVESRLWVPEETVDEDGYRHLTVDENGCNTYTSTTKDHVLKVNWKKQEADLTYAPFWDGYFYPFEAEHKARLRFALGKLLRSYEERS